MLIDVVAKNGNLLLSIPVKSDGTIDDKERKVLADIKAWMDINSESIYGTRMWKTFGEGPLAEAANPMNAQGFNEGQAYSAQDVRYVVKDGKVYATIMAWPKVGDFTFKAFSTAEATYSGDVEKVELLGYKGEISFKQNLKGLTIRVPNTKPNNIAPVFRIMVKNESGNAKLLLQSLIEDMEETIGSLTMHSYNTGKYNSTKLEQVRTAIDKAKNMDPGATNEICEAARQELAKAWHDFNNNGLNKGGAFSGIICENLTSQYLIEASGFSRAEGGNKRFGKPKNWQVENFCIPNNGDGTKQGLDKYSGNEALMLGVWNDAKSNTKGDLHNARIYRKVTLPAGKYYFGAAYNTTYNISQQAYMFVGTKLSETANIPDEALAYYPIANCTKDLKMQGLYFQIDEETELYIGFQADLLNGSTTQEFRAEQVALYAPKEGGEMHSAKNGWQKIDKMPDDVSQYFYAFYDHGTDRALVLGKGNNQGAENMTMWYEDDVYPETNKHALWMLDAFDENNYSGAKGENAKWLVITPVSNADYCMQHDNAWNFRIGNNGEGWTDRCYVAPTYMPEGYWTLTNNNGNGYIGHWDDTDEIAGNATDGRIGRYDIYAIERGKYVAAVENLTKGSEDSPIDLTYLITNAEATRYNNFHAKQPVGWNLSLDDAFEVEYANYLPSKVGDSYFNKWQGSGNISNRSMGQTITALPAGKYRVSVTTSATTIHNGAWLFANDKEADMTKLSNNCANIILDINNGTLDFGVKLKNYQSNDCKFDHFTLEFLGNNNESTGISEQPTFNLNNENQQKVKTYSISGMRLNNPTNKGIYIEVKNGKSKKIIR